MIDRLIEAAVESINGSEKAKAVLGQKLRKHSSIEYKHLEKGLYHEVEQKVLNQRIAGVDSGFTAKGFGAVDVSIARAMAVVFEYSQGRLSRAEYLPGLYSFPLPELSSDVLERDEVNNLVSLRRLKEELSLALRVVKEKRPDYMLLDGSIVPQHADKPRKDSNLGTRFSEIISLFEKLYASSKENDCTLVGVVEDSRGVRLSSLLKETLGQYPGLGVYSDSSLLGYVLKQGERSCVFSYSSNPEKHPILGEFRPEWRDNIHAFYLRPSELDRPLRCEFIGKQKTREIASTVLALSSLHREYAYPSVLIEADLRAKLKPEEVEIVYNKITDKLGKKAFFSLRRNKRPL